MPKHQLFLILLITLSTYQSCEEGCLTCKDNECLVCDLKNEYIYKSGKCIPNPVRNCIDYVGEMCVGCVEEHFVDVDANRCVSLIQSDKIPNCLNYTLERQCSGCEKDYYLKPNFTCALVTSKIANCEFYKNESVCVGCATNFTLKLKGNSCMQNPVVSKCALFTTGSCLECEGNKIMEKNFITYNLFAKLNSKDKSLIKTALNNYYKTDLSLENSCLAPTVENCKVFTSFDFCKECNENYFLKDGKCYVYPKEVIPNCGIYVKEDECKECQSGFYLKTSTECPPVIPISNCELYDPKADETICKKCWTLYYLDNNKCTLRENISDLCETYAVSLDKCETCQADHTVTSDGKNCLESVENCETYVATTFESTSHQCEQCKPLYYLENVNQCVKGTIPFCWIYKANQNFCNECTSKHWVSNGACIAHELVAECQKYDKTTQDTCTDCRDESILMQKTTNCSPVFIEGCETYSSFENCDTCKDGYDKVSALECKALDVGLNCLRAESGDCKKCQVNFVLIGNECRRPFKYEVELCDKTNIDGTLNDHNGVQCDLCLEGTFPYNYKDSYVCVENDEVELLLAADLVPDCLGYEKIGGSYKCTRCDDNKVLKNGACVNNCGPNSANNFEAPLKRFVFKDDGTGKKKLKNLDFCEETVDTSCKVKSFQFNGSIFVDVCVDDLREQAKVVTLNDINYIIFKKEDLKLETKSENLFKRSNYAYTTLTSIKSTNSVSEREHMLQNCDYFYGLPNSETGCLNCRFGQFGRVLNWKVDHCHTYDTTAKTCTKCVHGYYPTDSNLKCTKIDLPACVRFSLIALECLLCKEYFFVDTGNSNVCTKVTLVENCEFYRTHEDSCAKCDEDFILNDARDKCLKRLDHCIDHVTTFTTGDLECLNCEDGFYLDLAGLCSCENLTPNCWRYEQTKGDSTCEFYNNAFEFRIQNYCQSPTPIANCAKYSDLTTCSECKEGYYFSNDTNCVRNRFYDSDGNGTELQIAVDYCLKNITDQVATTCNKCIEGYYLNSDGDHCCQLGSYWDGSVCQERAVISGNTLNCGVWDRFLHRCIACKTGFYRNDITHICCADGQYRSAEDTCTIIPTGLNCLHSNDGTICTKCVSGKFLRSGNCCDNVGDYWKNDTDGCTSYATDLNCDTYSEDLSECTACAANYYLASADKICCGNTVGFEEYWKDAIDGCTAVPAGDKIPDCTKYNSDKKCTECVTTHVVSSEGDFCCLKTFTYNNIDTQGCIGNQYLFMNCLALDSYSSKQRLCNKCKSEFYLSYNTCVAHNNFYTQGTPDTPTPLIANCLEGLDTTTCTKCEENYYYDATNNICCEHNTFFDSGNCESYQIAQLNYAFNDTPICEQNDEVITYLSNSLRCCMEGQYASDNKTCGVITDSNCLRSNDDTICLKCKSGYHIDSDACVVDATNCKVGNSSGAAASQTCTECEEGYILTADDTCTLYITNTYATPCTFPFVTDLCLKVDYDNTKPCFCGVNTGNADCNPFSYKNDGADEVCCPLGYIYSTTKGCTKILDNEYCAKYNTSDYTECEICFLNENYCTINSNHKFSLERLKYSQNGSLSTSISFTDEYASTIEFNYLGSDTKKCCPLGKYWNGSSCEFITAIPNCWKYEAGICTKCKDEYKPSGIHCCKDNEIYDTFYRTCVINDSGIDCLTGKYLTNGHCCTTGSYWDIELDRCMELFDVNCEESDSKSKCDKCAPSYILDSYKYKLELNFKTLKNCINPNETFVIQFCIPDTGFGLDYAGIRKFVDNCGEVNLTNKSCTQCMSNTYQTPNNPFCCKESYFGYKNICRPLENLIENCENYDHLTRECKKCSDNYHLSKGICCEEGKFLNAVTMKCEYVDLNCKTFDVDVGFCTDCDNTKYYTNGHCCDHHTKYDKTEKKCVKIIGNGLKDVCEKLDDFGTCQKCTLDYYLHKKHCCLPGSFWNEIRQTCQTEICEDLFNPTGAVDNVNSKTCDWYWNNKDQCGVTTTLVIETACCACGGGDINQTPSLAPYKSENCKYFGHFNDCVECLDGFYFNNGKCCAHGTFWDITDSICVTDFEYVGCKEYKDDGTCSTCSDSYYFTNDHCCKDRFYWDGTTANKCVLINKKYHEYCAQALPADLNTCLVCITGSYMSDEKHCCPEGEWWNKESQLCETIATGLTDCVRTGDNVNCDKCINNKIAFLLDGPDMTLEYIFTCQLTATVASTAPLFCDKASPATLNEANKCLICQDAYWKPAVGECCPHGFGQGGVCATAITDGGTGGDTDCKESSSTGGQCALCNDNFHLVTGYCVEGKSNGQLQYLDITTTPASPTPTDTTIADCELAADATLCSICSAGYTNTAGVCSANSGAASDETCSYDASSSKCVLCVSGEYLEPVSGKCCLDNKFYDSGTDSCISLDIYDPAKPFNCIEVDNTKCIKCEVNNSTPFYLSHNGRCCEENKYDNQTSCVSKTEIGLQYCKQYANSSLCKMTTTDEKTPVNRQASCKDDGSGTDYYFTNDHCCPITQLWDVSGSTCVLIATKLSNPNCNKVDEDNLCIECTNGSDYLSNGYCCAVGTFRKDGGTCENITRNNCQQRSNTKCKLCSTGNIDSIHDECCDTQYFSTVDKICVNKPDNCDDVDGNGDCLNCKTSFYLTNKRCCADSFYWNGTACVNDNLPTDCLQIADYDTSDITFKIQCSLCNDKKVRNGKCCEKDELFFLELGCMKSKLIIDSCLELNDDGSCKKCNSSTYVSSGVCCAENTKFDTVTNSGTFLQCIDIPDDQNCKQYSNGECTICESTHYLNEFITNKKCCLIGRPNEDDTNCESTATDPLVPHCIKFNEEKDKCLECNTGYNLYTDHNLSIENQKNHCCPDGKYLNIDTILEDGEYRCDLIEPKPLNCDEFSLASMKCKVCKTGFELVDGNCCATGTYWNKTELKCLKLTYPNCKKQNATECLECDSADYYLKNKGCCKIQHHWDNDSNVFKCVENTEKLCYEFDKSTGLCIKCDDTTGAEAYLYDGGNHCCYRTFVWENNVCKRLIQNCEQYKRNVADDGWLCKKCTTGFNLSDDESSCCDNETFFIDNAEYGRQCVTDPLIDRFLISCQKYDHENINCLECGEGYYVSNGVCCEDGKYRVVGESYECKDIPVAATSDANCIQYDGTNCTKCNEGFKLNSTSFVCVAILPDCTNFNADTAICSECRLGKYVSNNNCCHRGNWWDTSSCTAITAGENCLEQQTASTCQVCKENYYKVSDYCCEYSNYCSAINTSEAGTIDNCQQYSTDKNTCSECDNLYNLVTLSTGSTFCYPIPQIENCSDSSVAEVNSENQLTCDTCADQYFKSTQVPINQFYEHFYYPVEKCVGFDNKYVLSASTLNCKKCADDFFLNGTTCTPRTASSSNCLVKNLDEDKCLQCKDEHWFDPADGLCKDHGIDNPKCKFYNGTDCELCETDGDLYWRIFVNTWPTCELKANFIPDEIKADDPSLWPGYIYKCRKNFECSEEYLNGLSIQLQKFVSCHKCNNSDKIPFISLRIDDTTNSLEGLQKYSTSQPNTQNLNNFTDDNVNFTNQCHLADLSEFTLVTGTNNFPADCGIGIINSTLKADTTESNSATPAPTKLGIFCGACKPGFAPTVNATKVFYVEACVSIDNCETFGTAFNQCDKCADNFAFNYNTDGIDRSSCVGVSSNKHCYAYDETNTDCIICKKGYSLNLENICELLDAPYCEGNKMAKNSFLEIKDYELIIFRGIVGCQECSSGFSGIFKTENEYVCTQSPYIKKGTFITPNPAFNQHCKQYGIDTNGIYCHLCKEDYVVTIKSVDLNNIYGRCLSKNGNLQNCAQANNNSTCAVCEDTHTLVNSACVTKNISNCQTYSNTLTVLTCTTCNDYYYKSGNECVLGQIADCLTYTSETVCAACKIGFQRVDTKDGKHYCIPVTTHENCSDFHDADFQNLKLTCTKCESGFLLETISNSDDYKKLCNRIQLIPFCSKYDKQSTFELSTFNCLECHQGYYLTNNSCHQRLLSLTNCLTYSVTSDTCDACENDYYLNTTNTECLINPSGITGCAVFTNDDECLSCKASYFLSNNKCELVPTNNLIVDCIQYSDNQTCSKCLAGKALDSNQCKEPEVQNCEVYTTAKSCFRCNDDYGLKASGDLKLCEPLPIISNCNTVTTEFPFECSKCLDGYYLETDTSTNVLGCKIANPLIDNCKEYLGNDQCSRCNENYIVSADNKSCFLYKTNTNCVSYKETENPFCILCSPGYKLNSQRECVTLTQDPNKGIAANPGCALFNFYDSAICEVCSSKHYMDKKGMCIKILTQEDIDNASNATDVPDNVPLPSNQKEYIDLTFAKFGVIVLALFSFMG